MIEMSWQWFSLIVFGAFVAGFYLAARIAYETKLMAPPSRPPDEPPRIDRYFPEPSEYLPMPKVPAPKAEASAEHR